jgi:hypothetical protein
VIITRLIDVGSVDPYRTPRIVKLSGVPDLIRFQDGPNYPSHAALSYCWGPNYDKSCLPYDDNEITFMQSLPSLPKKIDDVVKICRRIGIRYLWVDALCIMQARTGRSIEWSEEAAKVGFYYQNALFTIVATGLPTITKAVLHSNHIMVPTRILYRVVREEFW